MSRINPIRTVLSEIAVGTQLNERIGIEASWVHFSHAQLAGRQNPGIDNIGVRMNLAL